VDFDKDLKFGKASCQETRRADYRGLQFKSWSRDLGNAPLWPNFVFLNWYLVVPSWASNFNLIGLIVMEILRL